MKVELPDIYSENIGEPVDATVSEVPFRESVNPNVREVVKSKGLDSAT